ncbi:MAG: hypothetical protein NTZ97_02200 [Candidatus Moranbacteria bacterium]|nr:hypothetical protein [Candidatus Moranbacteria bacterium]
MFEITLSRILTVSYVLAGIIAYLLIGIGLKKYVDIRKLKFFWGFIEKYCPGFKKEEDAPKREDALFEIYFWWIPILEKTLMTIESAMNCFFKLFEFPAKRFCNLLFDIPITIKRFNDLFLKLAGYTNSATK